jgi:hypothetical protein
MALKGGALMFAAVLTAAMLATGQLPAAPPLEDLSSPKLVARGKGYFLHTLSPSQRPAALRRVLPLREGEPSYSLLLLHTSAATGEMRVLAAGGDLVSNLAQKNKPDTYRGRILGVAADRERLYVLHWGEGPSERAVRLLVFRPDTGEQLHSLAVEGDAVPQQEPREAVDKGPLRLCEGGVACFGTRFEFEEAKFLRRSPDKGP